MKIGNNEKNTFDNIGSWRIFNPDFIKRNPVGCPAGNWATKFANAIR